MLFVRSGVAISVLKAVVLSKCNSKMSPPRHMAIGDPFPPKTPGKPRLYNMQYCPFALRAKLILTKTGIDFEVINIDLNKKPSWFLEKYPAGTVPVLEIDDKVIPESLIVSEYVDEVYSKPGEGMFPTDPYEKAKTRVLLANEFPKAISGVYKWLYGDTCCEAFFQAMEKLEKVLSTQPFFAGSKLGYADYMIWPWLRYIGVTIDKLADDRFPQLNRWLVELKKDEIIIKCSTPAKVLKKFAEGYKTKNFVYELE